MQHLDEGTIHAWLDGALDAEESARVEEHAAGCASCAAAIAEARGLVAGASRILASLDNMPAGVIPRESTSTIGRRVASQQGRALWRVLHLTPTRAAAAAVVFLAVGTALVLRQKPNGNAVEFAAYSPPTSTVAPPVVATPAAPPAPSVRTRAAQAAPEKKSTVESRAEVRATRPVESVVVTSAQRPTVADSAAAGNLTSDVQKRAVPVPMPSAAPRAAIANEAKKPATGVLSDVTVTSAVGGVAGRASEPMPERARFGPANGAGLARAGCYAVSGDSLADLPRRIVLDSVSSATGSMALRSAQRDVAPEARSVSGFVDGTRQRLRNWSWAAMPDGGIHLSSGAGLSIELNGAPGSDELKGTTARDARQVVVVLRRADCARE